MTRHEALWKFYDEHAAQARQHENQRERMTNIILIVAGALIGFLSASSSATIYSFISSLALIPLGLFGWAFSSKHYERNHYHRAILSKIRDAIDDEMFPGPNGPQSDTLKQLRDAGELAHYSNFPAPAKNVQVNAKRWIARQRLNPFWSAVPLLVTILGIAFASIIAFQLWEKDKKESNQKASATTEWMGAEEAVYRPTQPLHRTAGLAPIRR